MEAKKKSFKGTSCEGRTLGVLGLGAIGSMVARVALDMDMEVVGYDPATTWMPPGGCRREVRRMENLAACSPAPTS